MDSVAASLLGWFGEHVLNGNVHGFAGLDINHGDLPYQACVHHEARAEAARRVEVPTGALLEAHAPCYSRRPSANSHGIFALLRTLHSGQAITMFSGASLPPFANAMRWST